MEICLNSPNTPLWRGEVQLYLLPGYLLSYMRGAALHILSSQSDILGEFGLFAHTFSYI